MVGPPLSWYSDGIWLRRARGAVRRWRSASPRKKRRTAEKGRTMGQRRGADSGQARPAGGPASRSSLPSRKAGDPRPSSVARRACLGHAVAVLLLASLATSAAEAANGRRPVTAASALHWLGAWMAA